MNWLIRTYDFISIAVLVLVLGTLAFAGEWMAVLVALLLLGSIVGLGLYFRWGIIFMVVFSLAAVVAFCAMTPYVSPALSNIRAFFNREAPMVTEPLVAEEPVAAPAVIEVPLGTWPNCQLTRNGRPFDPIQSDEDQACRYLELPGETTMGEVNSSGVWTPAQKCTWLRENFPQTTAGVQALGAQLAGVPVTRIATHGYRCSPDSMAFDGFIVLGDAEGWGESFSLNVPVGGAVDAYQGANCTGRSDYIGPETDTLRCFDGSVTATRATYWPWLDEAPPTSGVSMSAGDLASNSASVTVDCVDPTDLARENGWNYSTQPDKYGGLQVTLTDNATLPNDWEAIGQGGTRIGEFDSPRTMSTGTYTVYPPFGCRDELGYSK
jgi:hypothetical protein